MECSVSVARYAGRIVTVMQPLLARITLQRFNITAGPNFLPAARFT